jgi:hypothetical protein
MEEAEKQGPQKNAQKMHKHCGKCAKNAQKMKGSLRGK